MLCRGLNFAIPRSVSAKDIQASFESAYRTLEHNLDEDKKELTVATLRSIALNYIERKSTPPPKTLLRSINQLEKRDDIVITKPDKGTGVVVMDRSEYTKLLNEASINNAEKFKSVSLERPKSRGRPVKHYHPLLRKEKELETAVRKILPKEIADSICPKGSRLAHLYGLPKTHKPRLAMRPILSATGTYNFKLAKWLDEKLKSLSLNKYPLKFAEKLREKQMAEGDILVSYDVASLFTNVPVDETIQILADKAFEKEWFNWKYKLKLEKFELVELLKLAVKHQLFQIDGKLYEQVDGVAMGSPLGPLMANAFMCSIEEKLEERNLMPSFYHRFVDDSITSQRNIASAEAFLSTLNSLHPSLQFTMELEIDGVLPFLGTTLINKNGRLETKVYIKPTNTGLMLHYDSHVDVKYKKSLVLTMLNRAFRLSSSWKLFTEECERLKKTFVRLRYPISLLDNIITKYTAQKRESDDHPAEERNINENVVRVMLPFKDQKSADSVRRQLRNLSKTIGRQIQPVYTSRKIAADFPAAETKPPLVNQQCVVYLFKCDLCDADYVGYTCRHLHQRIDEHKSSVVGEHMVQQHGEDAKNIEKNFKVLRKCRGKFECLLYEMLFIKDLKPSLNKQSDSIRSKLFT